MTKFTDQLFDDLMREHGDGLTRTTMRAPAKRHLTARPVLLTAGAGGLATVAAVGTLVAGGGTPAYAVTTHPNGTVTLAVYQTSGIAGANSKLHELGDRVVVVPVQAGCPSIGSLPAPAVRAAEISVQVSGSSDGSVTVDAHGIPAGDILVLGVSAVDGQFQFFPRQSTSQDHSTEASPPTEVNPSTKAGHSSRTSNSAEASHAAGSRGGSGPGEWMPGPNGSVSKLTSGPAPSCVSVPPGPATNRP
jgi:hypothetical protein